MRQSLGLWDFLCVVFVSGESRLSRGKCEPAPLDPAVLYHFQVKGHGQIKSSSFALKCPEVTGLHLECGRQEAVSLPPGESLESACSLRGKLTSTLASFKNSDGGETCLER